MAKLNLTAVFILVALTTALHGAEATPAPRIESDISYLTDTAHADDYAKSQCKLDLHLPTKPQKDFPLVVWFHGGGLTGGNKAGEKPLFQRFNDNGIAVASVGYRFSPKVKYPTYLQDAAKAVAWCVTEGVKRGADPKAIFVSGHSAGGYITAMLAMDERLLKEAGVPVDMIAGYVPLSDGFSEHLKVLILPTLTLALPQMALFFRYLNAGLRDTAGTPFVTAWVKTHAARLFVRYATRLKIAPVTIAAGQSAG